MKIDPLTLSVAIDAWDEGDDHSPSRQLELFRKLHRQLLESKQPWNSPLLVEMRQRMDVLR